jgi:hypothetical protein
MLALDLVLEVGAKLGVRLGAHRLDDRRSARPTVGSGAREPGRTGNERSEIEWRR